MTVSTADPGSLIACPQCDALHHDRDIAPDQTAVCVRCGTVLFAPRPNAIGEALALAVAALALMMVAAFFPFLSVTASGLSSSASVLDTVRAYSAEEMAPLSLAIAALILVLPIIRLLLMVWIALPLAAGRPAWPGARAALRLDAALRPWSMAEIFMVGVAVAMVKIGGLADLRLGPAFWSFAAVAMLFAAKDALICERSLWRLLDAS